MSAFGLAEPENVLPLIGESTPSALLELDPAMEPEAVAELETSEVEFEQEAPVPDEPELEVTPAEEQEEQEQEEAERAAPEEVPEREVPQAAPEAMAEEKEARGREEPPAGLEVTGEEDESKAQDLAEVLEEVEPSSEEDAAAAEEGAVGLEGEAAVAMEPVLEQPEQEVEGVEVGAEPTMAAVRAQIRRRASAIPVAPITAGTTGAGTVQSTAASRAELLRIKAAEVPRSAEQVMPPAPQGVPETLPTPQDPVPGARRHVEEKSGRSLPAQSSPALVASPFGNLPRLGDVPLAADMIRQLHHILEEGPPVSDPNDEARMRLLALRERLLDRSTPQPGQGQPVPLQEPRPPERPALTQERKTQLTNVIARLLASKGQEARRLVSRARRSSYPNDALERVQATAALGDDTLAPELEQALDKQLTSIAVEAGIATTELQTAVDERHRVLEERVQAEEARLAMSLPDARSELGVASEAVSGAVVGARTWMDARARAVEDGSTSPTAAITAQRDALLADVTRRVSRADVVYQRAADTREQDLSRIEREQIAAYQAAAQRDEFQLNENRGSRTQLDVQTDVARTTDWLRERTAFVRRETGRMKQEAHDASKSYRGELSTAGDEAREMVRQWADVQRGEERSFWERLFDGIRDWMDKARASADAWESVQNQELAQAVSGDLDMLDRVMQAGAAGISEQELLTANQLSAEEQAIVRAYFNPDPAEGDSDPIGAVAAGMRERIFSQSRNRLEKQLRDLLAGDTFDWKVLEQVAQAAGNSRFDAGHLASEIYHALHGGLTGLGTDEERAYRAMAGLGPLEALALRRCYKQEFEEDLDADLTREFSGGELQRAQALLAGDRARADAAALYSAMQEAGVYGLGTDEDAIMQTLRNKTPEEVERITRLYREMYGKELREELRGELDDWATLTTHDADRAEALLRSDQAAADAIAIDQQLHGFSWANAFNVTYGTSFQADARDEVAAIYEQVRRDVTEQADREGWTAAQMDAELTRRTQAISRAYGREYGLIWGTLDESLRSRFSGQSQDLVVALSQNDRAGADAARLRIEQKSPFHSSDREMNRVLESQYDRALEDVRRDLAPERRRALLGVLDAEEERHYRETGQRWTPAERWRRQQLVERQLTAELELEAQRRADQNMQELNSRYARRYGESVESAISEATQGHDRERAQLLLRQDGYLTRYQRFDFSVRGAGTSEEDARRAMEGASRQELDQMRTQWALDHPGETLDERALGELSGTDAMDMRIALMGAPETVEDRLRIEQARFALEQPTNVFGAALAGPEKAIMSARLAQLEVDVQRMHSRDLSPQERARLLEDFDVHAGAVQTAVEDHRSAVSEITDSVANAAGIAVAVIVGAVGSVFTGGASAAVALAIIASLASTAASVGTRYLLMGNQYGHEELLMDLGLGLVDAVVAGLTAGLGNRLLGISQIGRQVAPVVTRAGLRGAAQRMSIALGKLLGKLGNTGRMTQAMRPIAALERMAQGRWLSRLAAHGISQTMENAVQSLPTAVVGNVLNDQAWERGNPLVNIVRGTTEQMGHGLAMGLAMSAGHASVNHAWGAAVNFRRGPRLGGAPDVVPHEHLLTTPEAREAALREYTQRTGKTEADFDALVSEQRRRQLEDFLAGGRERTEADFDAMLQAERSARLAEYQQMYPGKTEADFNAEVGRRSAEAHSDVELAASRQEAVRKQLESTLPEDARGLAREVPVTEVSRAEMARLTGNPMADAAVVVRDGQVHVVVREGAPATAVHEHVGRLVELVEPGTAGRAKAPELSLPSDLRNRVEVRANPELQGGTVRVHYESSGGLITSVWVEVGPRARAVDIHMHVQTVRSMRQLQGMSGRVRRLLDRMGQWLGRNPRAGPGSRAWEAQLELEKLPRIIEERAQALRLATDPEERVRIAFEVESLRLQVEEHARAVRSMEQEPSRGYVAAKLPDPETVKARLADLPPEVREVLRSRGALVEAYVAMYGAPFRALLETTETGALHPRGLEKAERFATALQMLLGGPEATARIDMRLAIPQAETHLHISGLLEPEHIVRQLERVIEGTRTPGTEEARAQALKSQKGWVEALQELLSGRETAKGLSAEEHTAVKQAQKSARERIDSFIKQAEETLSNPTEENHQLLGRLREQATEALQTVLTMPLSGAQVSPLIEQFFSEWGRQKKFFFGADKQIALLGMALQDYAERTLPMVELRQGVSEYVEAWMHAHRDEVHGLISTQVRTAGGIEWFIPKLLERFRAGELPFLLGFDLSGMETGGLGKTKEGTPTRGLKERSVENFELVHEHNYEQLSHLLNGDGELPTAVREYLATRNDPRLELLRDQLRVGQGTDPFVIGRAIAEATQQGRMDMASLALWNRVIRESLEHVGGQRGTNYLAVREGFLGLLGTTVHAGEQVHGRVALSTLLADLDLVLNSGADRIGHGVILGTSFVDPINPDAVNTALLTRLGFNFEEETGMWVRGKESYETKQILEMERTRRELLERAAGLGVVIEINPTSNVVISGLDPRGAHPLAAMLREAPTLRASVNTDNAGMHLTDPRIELAYLLATESLTSAQAVRVVLEGFASRMGGRPLANALVIRQQMENAFVSAVRTLVDRRNVLIELEARYGILVVSPHGNLGDDGAFRQALQPYLNVVF